MVLKAIGLRSRGLESWNGEGRQEKEGVLSRDRPLETCKGFGYCSYSSAKDSAELDVFMHTQNCVAH